MYPAAVYKQISFSVYIYLCTLELKILERFLLGRNIIALKQYRLVPSDPPDLISEMGGVLDDLSLCYWLSSHVNKHIDWLIKTEVEEAISKRFS